MPRIYNDPHGNVGPVGFGFIVIPGTGQINESGLTEILSRPYKEIFEEYKYPASSKTKLYYGDMLDFDVSEEELSAMKDFIQETEKYYSLAQRVEGILNPVCCENARKKVYELVKDAEYLEAYDIIKRCRLQFWDPNEREIVDDIYLGLRGVDKNKAKEFSKRTPLHHFEHERLKNLELSYFRTAENEGGIFTKK